ncbi:MAG: VTT domain-containing protein [Bacteroidia bacterium]|nr:VTT domain-containing protein [Bacteroidia bacterium]
METTWEFLKKLTDPESILSYGGLALLLFVIFAETGLFFGFFLPGDSLVFLSGVFCATKPEYLSHTNIFLLILYLSLAAILGNITGYYFGRATGDKLFKRDDSLFFKKRHVTVTKAFYEKHGKKTLILGRFIPYVRTFAPILAGVIKIELSKFFLYTVAGAFLWIGSLTSIGFFLGRKFPGIEKHLGWIVIGLIVVTTIPVVRTYLKEKKRNAKGRGIQ